MACTRPDVAGVIHMHIPVTERWPPQWRTCVQRIQWEQLIIASHIVKRSNIGDTKGLGRAAVPRVTAVKCTMACTRCSQDNIFTTDL